MRSDVPFVQSGNSLSEQAEASNANPAAGNVQMRILIELQVLTMLLANAYEISDQLPQLRLDVAKSIS